jgi:hypothetical protein
MRHWPLRGHCLQRLVRVALLVMADFSAAIRAAIPARLGAYGIMGSM